MNLRTTVHESFDAVIGSTLTEALVVDKVAEHDIFSYSLCGSVWLSMIKDRCGNDILPFLSLIRKKGLFYAIDCAAKFSQKLCTTNEQERYKALADLVYECGELRCVFDGWVRNNEQDPYGLVSLLRFPKRLTVTNKNVEAECIMDFSRHNASMFYAHRDYVEGTNSSTTDCKLSGLPYKENADKIVGKRTISEYSPYVVSHVASALREVFPLDKMFSELDKVNLDTLDPLNVPTGVCADAETPYSKVVSIISELPGLLPWCDYYRVPRRFPAIKPLCTHGCVKFDLSQYLLTDEKGKTLISNELSFAHVTSVPKGHDEVRIIAEEQVVRQCIADGVVKDWTAIVATATNGSVTLNDQSRQQELARQASLGTLATIDWHHASDGYSTEVGRALLGDYYNVINKTRSQWLHINDQLVYNSIMFTMGHKLTPVVQSMFFYSICYAALTTYNALTGDEIPATLIGVYNDDTIVPIQIADLVLDFGKKLGLEPNLKKTFTSINNLYRESCGVEYFNGVSITPVYWPRKQLKIKDTKDVIQYLDTLIAVQHKIYTYATAEAGLCHVLETLFPKLTYSQSLTDSVRDLYGPYRTVEKIRAPYDKDRITDLPDDPAYYRTKHFGLSSTWPEPKSVLPVVKDFAEFLTYCSYLQYGPLYETPVDELLRVSTRRNSKKWYVDEVRHLTPYYDRA